VQGQLVFAVPVAPARSPETCGVSQHILDLSAVLRHFVTSLFDTENTASIAILC
jgi:hypothetical protein